MFLTATATQSSRSEGSSREEHRNPLRQQEKPGQMCARSPSEPSRHCSVATHHPSCPRVPLSSLLLKPTPQGLSKVSAHWCCVHLLCSWPTLGIRPLHVPKPPANAAEQILPGASLGHHHLVAFFWQSQTQGPEARGLFPDVGHRTRSPKACLEREDSVGRNRRWMCWELLLGGTAGHAMSLCGWVRPAAQRVQQRWSPRAPEAW